MDKQVVVGVASSGVNLVATAAVFMLLNKKVCCVEQKVDDLAIKIDALIARQEEHRQPDPDYNQYYQRAATAPYYGRRQNAGRTSVEKSAPTPQNPQTSINMAHTLTNIMDNVLGGFNTKKEQTTEEKLGLPGIPPPSTDEISAELKELEEEENGDDSHM